MYSATHVVGGQSIPKFDYDLSKGIVKTFKKRYRDNLIKGIVFHTNIDKDEVTSVINAIHEDIEKSSGLIPSLSEYNKFQLMEIQKIAIHGFKWGEVGKVGYHIFEMGEIEKIQHTAYKLSVDETDRATYQAMESLIHNLNTMHSRAGCQTPFSSINYGTDTSPEGRMIIKNILLAEEAGLGHGETPIFPIHIFKVKEGVNFNPGDPNYDMFKLACRVSAKRMFPNFEFIDAPFNLQYYKEGDPNTEIAMMGCVRGNSKIITVGHNDDFYQIEIEQMWKHITEYFGIKPISYGLSEYIDMTSLNNSALIIDGSEYKCCHIKKIIKNPNMHNWVKISFDNGSFLECTNDHPLPVFRCGFIEDDNNILKVDVDKSGGFSNVFNRTCAMSLKIGDLIPMNSYNKGSSFFNTSSSKLKLTKITNIENIDIDECSYDVETSTDRFAVNDIISHNCRTRVMGNVHDPSREIPVSRGNLSFTSINLPRLAIESKGDINKFFELLDEMMNLVIAQLKHRFKIQCQKHVYNFPFLMGQGVWLDSEKLIETDDISEVLKHGSLSVGFIGLAECLVALIGKHHGESEEAQELGLKIIRHMRERTDKESEETHLNFTLFATPAESLSGRFIRIDKKRYGIIPGVTDKDYYTNSTHVPVYYPISAFDKIRIEAPYHELTNAGHISYVELDGDPTENLHAFEKIVRYMKQCGIGYGAINHPIDTDPICGYTGVIKNTCPHCGRREHQTMIAHKRIPRINYKK